MTSKETIFVVDDNRQISDFLSRKLLPSLGYETTVSYDGQSALKFLKDKQFSIMLLDFQLPDMTGIEVLQNLSSEGRSIPTIFMTAHGSEQVVVDAFRLGVYDYLSKPIDEELLKFAIERILRETRLQREKRQLTTRLREQLALHSVLTQVGKSVTSTLELDEVLKRIVEAAVLLTKADEGFLALLDGKTDQLYLRAAKNIDEDRSKTIRLPIQDTLVGEVLSKGKPARINQSPNNSQIRVSTGYLVQSILHVPLIAKGQRLGVLSAVNRYNQQPFKEKDESLLISLADYASIALTNANLYEKSQQEITERKRIEDTLREAEGRYALAVRGANDGIWDWDLKSNKIYFSPRWKSTLGYGDTEIGDSPSEWFSRVHPEDIERLKLELTSHFNRATAHFENEHRMQHKDGTYRWILSRGLAIWDNTNVATRIAGSQTDITDRKYAEDKLLHDAFYDKLTGLPNRALFMDHLNLAVERSKRRDDYTYAVLFMDLDRFKDINDRFGHLTGDRLLVEVSKILEGRMRSTDTVARFGGDEFVILLEDIDTPESAQYIADWIQKELSSPFHISNHETYITSSIGIVLSNKGYTKAEDVLRDADIAMYIAKGNGRARHEIFSPPMRENIMNKLELEADLRQAIDKGQLSAHYQLIVSLESGEIASLETLIRWNHPQKGIIAPPDFIPLAEETGLIIAVDRWILREACKQLKKWQQEIPSLSKLKISVNVSGKNLSQPDLIDYIESVLNETGLAGENLILEITETNLLENSEMVNSIFQKLKNLGVEIQIDDFGIGYSSLSYLSNFPINALKIDRSFVSNITEDSNNLKIVQAIIMLSHRLGVGVIAEGLETENQLNKLRSLGCEFGQGFFVSRPIAGHDTQTLLAGIASGNEMPIREYFEINKQ
ncbi:MAG: EAL domain-containing protein [Anaerolineales bacterium]|nr:MAG: EAL domain-containing protein [Anaerolineales bacterium]